jgi:DNA-directed RNA polymerase-3 subunit RPC5
MRPQFHHIDAHAEQERHARARDPASMPARAPEARAIHMTVKASVDGEDDTTDTMAERITATQAESWQDHQFIDEDDEAAWNTFEQNLFVEAVVDPHVLLESDLSLLSVAKDPELLDTTSVPRETAKLSRNKKIRREKRSRRKEPVLEADQSHSSGTLSSDSEGGALA